MEGQELFDRAHDLEETDPAQAIHLWRKLARAYPTRNSLIRLGSCAKDLDFCDEAREAFEKALAIDNRSTFAMVPLGILAMDRYDYPAAVNYLRAAASLREDQGTYSLLGVALKNIGDEVGAEEAYNSSLHLDPNYEEAHYNLGVLLRNTRREEAEAHFRRAVAIDPDYACAHRELGWVLYKQSDSEAETHLRKALELDPRDGWAHVYLGSYLWGDDVNAAVAEFHTAREQAPDWTVPYWSLGNIHEYVLEDFGAAEAFFEQALQLDPDDVITLTSLGRLLQQQGHVEEATAYLTRALNLDPLYEKARKLLASLD